MEAWPASSSGRTPLPGEARQMASPRDLGGATRTVVPKEEDDEEEEAFAAIEGMQHHDG